MKGKKSKENNEEMDEETEILVENDDGLVDERYVKFLGYIHFANLKGPDFKYTLSFNSTRPFFSSSSETQLLYGTVNTSDPVLQPTSVAYHNNWRKLVNGGFVSLQAMIDQYILIKTGAINVQTEFSDGSSSEISNSLMSNIDLWAVPFPSPQWTMDYFSTFISQYIGIFFVLAFVWPITKMTGTFMMEKDLQFTNFFHSMGLKPSTPSLSCLLLYTPINAISAFFITLTVQSSPMRHSTGFFIWFYFF